MKDVIGSPADGLAVVVLTGIGSFSLFGFAFSETLFSYSSFGLSIALLLGVLLLALRWMTNRAGGGWDELDGRLLLSPHRDHLRTVARRGLRGGGSGPRSSRIRIRTPGRR